MPVRSYRDLMAWQRAMDMAVPAYQCRRRFPKGETHGLASPVRRAAVSVPSNVAEGQGRGAGAEFRHHLRTSQGSVQGVETQVIIAERLGYLGPDEAKQFLAVSAEVARLNRGLHSSIRDSSD